MADTVRAAWNATRGRNAGTRRACATRWEATREGAMRAAGVDPLNALARDDAWGAFEAAGSLFVPGPTGTNVNDFRAILIGDLAEGHTSKTAE